jgi:hypothetical protein
MGLTRRFLFMQKKKVYGIIYKGQTKHGSKVYIGQTINSLETRRKQHTKLNKIMPHWEIIDTAYSREELDDKEKYWIDHYDSMNPKKGFNRQHGKGKWSKQAVIDKRLKCNSNKEWFKDLSSEYCDYFYSIDIDKINKRLMESGYEELSKPQLCILKFFINIIINNIKPDKGYKIGFKTILISFKELIKELPYIKDYPDIHLQYHLLISAYDIFYFEDNESILGNGDDEEDWIYDAYAITLEMNVIQKYKRIYEMNSEYDYFEDKFYE